MCGNTSLVIGRRPGAVVSQPEVPGHWGFVMVLALTASLAARHHIDGDVAESACKRSKNPHTPRFVISSGSQALCNEACSTVVVQWSQHPTMFTSGIQSCAHMKLINRVAINPGQVPPKVCGKNSQPYQYSSPYPGILVLKCTHQLCMWWQRTAGVSSTIFHVVHRGSVSVHMRGCVILAEPWLAHRLAVCMEVFVTLTEHKHLLGP